MTDHPALARWKDLCLDATHGQLALGEFWASVLGLGIETSPGKVSLEGEGDHERMWINAVDRPRTVKNRLHLDVYAASAADLVALGATVLAPAEETGLGWTVMADPEGHEFCCFLRDPLPRYRLHGIGVDCVDAGAQATWWGRVLGRPVTTYEGEDWLTLEHATPDPVLTLDFAPVPEARVGPNRVHWDLVGDVDAILAAGATRLGEGSDWTVLADPEGNEFCVFAVRRAQPPDQPAGVRSIARVIELDLTADPVDLTVQLVDIESVSRDEAAIADAVESALSAYDHLTVTRRGHTVVARTDLGRSERVVIAGHLDTVPLNDNLPCRREPTPGGEVLHGLGTCDMKGGDAVLLHLAATLTEPVRDVTYIAYEAEEIDSEFNGLRLLAESDPDLVTADFAILMEPSNAAVEAGCQGTLRAGVRTTGERSHSARSWRGVNAIHAAGAVLDRLRSYDARQPVIDGLTYHEGLNAVGISGGVAGNVIPDECVVEVNYRYAPDRSAEDAAAYVHEFFDGFDVTIGDNAPGAMPGLDRPAAAAFVAAVGGEVAPKFGWTDVARFTVLGVPAVNFGPGDPMFAHKADEHVLAAEITRCADVLRGWLTGEASTR